MPTGQRDDRPPLAILLDSAQAWRDVTSGDRAHNGLTKIGASERMG
jgi:hypothetical protein